jgi:hypothetical protein
MRQMSALPRIADIRRLSWDVRFVPKNRHRADSFDHRVGGGKKRRDRQRRVVLLRHNAQEGAWSRRIA